MSSSSRRFVAALIRLSLVVLAIVLVGRFVIRRAVGRRQPVRIQTQVPVQDSLRPGDLRIFNADSSVDLILSGDRILAGLSPKTIAKVKQELETSASRDTSGLGASISQIVKKSVAGAIGTHAAYPLSDIRDIRYENEQIVVDWKGGKEGELFGNTKVNGSKLSNTFRADDAERFIAAVRARMGLPAAR
jgi:hypothetical protein